MSAIPTVEKINEKVKKLLMEYYKGAPEDAEVLIDIQVKRCKVADHDHYKDPRCYAHTMHEPNIICVSSSMELLDDENIYGILAHEYGHIIHSQFPELISGAENYPGEFEIEVDEDLEFQYVGGREVDHEIFADFLIEKLFGLRIWYDQKKVQWMIDEHSING